MQLRRHGAAVSAPAAAQHLLWLLLLVSPGRLQLPYNPGSTPPPAAAAAAAALPAKPAAAAADAPAAATAVEAEASDSPQLPCATTGHCSLGKVTPFLGDITPVEGLRAMLSARSYKRELVLVVSNAAFLPLNAQPYLHMKALGMGHWMVMSSDRGNCTEIAARLPEVGCAWNSAGPEVLPLALGGVARLWWLRYRTVLRAARLGYNVYSMDGDTAIFSNFYEVVTAPWARHVVWWNQEEGGISLNGGQVYLRNAAPGGPAVQSLWIVLNLILRWHDDDWTWARKRYLRPNCMFMDQDALNLVMDDQWVGRGTLSLCGVAAACQPEDKRDLHVRCLRPEGNWQNITQVTLTPRLQQLADSTTSEFKTRMLRMLHTKGWAKETGGQWWPRSRGKYSKQLVKLLQEDCPSCPPLLDPEDPSTRAAAAAAPGEVLALMPPWLTDGFYRRGRSGAWYPFMLGGAPPQQAIGHMWYMHLAEEPPAAKAYAMQSLGKFEFETTRQLLGGAEIYPACYSYGHPLVTPTNPSHNGCRDMQLLMLHPSVALEQTSSSYELSLILRGLASLATLMGRTLVWPDLPCNATRYVTRRPLVNPGQIRVNRPGGQSPLDLYPNWFPYGDFRCAWGTAFTYTCTNNRRGLQVWEVQDWISRQPDYVTVGPVAGVNILSATPMSLAGVATAEARLKKVPKVKLHVDGLSVSASPVQQSNSATGQTLTSVDLQLPPEWSITAKEDGSGNMTVSLHMTGRKDLIMDIVKTLVAGADTTTTSNQELQHGQQQQQQQQQQPEGVVRHHRLHHRTHRSLAQPSAAAAGSSTAVEAVGDGAPPAGGVSQAQQQQQQQEEEEEQDEQSSSDTRSNSPPPKSLLQRAFGRRLAGGEVPPAGSAGLSKRQPPKGGFSMGAQVSSAMGVSVPRVISAVSRTGSSSQPLATPAGSNAVKRWRAGDPGPSDQLSDIVKGMLEVTAQQVVDFMEQNPGLMDQQILYLATPVRVKELHTYAAAATTPPPPPPPAAAAAAAAGTGSSSTVNTDQGTAAPVREVEVPTAAAEAAQGYRRFVEQCHAFRDAHLLQRHPSEYGPDVPPLEPLMEEGRGLVLQQGQLVAST